MTAKTQRETNLRRPARALLCAGAMAITSSLAGVAGAQATDPGTAQVLYDAGMALMKDEKYAAACPKLEESWKLDPGVGTQFRLAECYEKLGRIARAWALYLDVAEATKRDKNVKREKQARDRADALKGRIPRLTIHVAGATADLPGVELIRDGAPMGKTQLDLAVPVDPGEHVLAARAPGKRAWERKLTLAEGASIEVSIPALEDAPPPKAPPGTLPATEGPPGAGLGTAGIAMRVGAGVAAAAGIAGIVVGGVFGARAKSQWSDALTHCAGVPDHCGAQGLELGGQASTSATISTAGFVAGGVLIAGGVVLWFTAPLLNKAPAQRAGLVILPAVAPGLVGGAVSGRF